MSDASSAPAAPARVPFAAVVIAGGALMAVGRYVEAPLFDIASFVGLSVLIGGLVSVGLGVAWFLVADDRVRTTLIGAAGIIGLIGFALALDLTLLGRGRFPTLGHYLVMAGGLLAFAGSAFAVVRRSQSGSPIDASTAVAAAAGGIAAVVGAFLGGRFGGLDPNAPFGSQRLLFLALGIAVAACAGGLLGSPSRRVRAGLALLGLGGAVIVTTVAIHDGSLL